VFTQLLEEPELGIAAHPIFDQLYAEMGGDILASEYLLAEVRIGEFHYFDGYFDGAAWDELTKLTVPMPITYAINRLVALTTDTQLMHIVDPAISDKMVEDR
jgi:hypothetical protein